MKFFTQWEPVGNDLVPFEECPDSMTETAGYIPTERLVQNFEEAGIKLEISRDFDFPNEDSVPDDYDPVTFRNRLDALALDADVKERLIAFAKRRVELEAIKEKEVEDGVAGLGAAGT